jgi:hypothetical protein
VAFLFVVPNANATVTPSAGWTTVPNTSIGTYLSYRVLTTTAPITGTATLNSSQEWVSALWSFGLVGSSLPSVVQHTASSGGFNPPQTEGGFTNPTTAGNTIIVACYGWSLITGTGGTAGIGLTDSQGNVYSHTIHSSGGVGGPELDVFIRER